jgi:hypothetical protein
VAKIMNEVDDLIWGVGSIAAVINQSPRQAHYALTKGLLPAGKIGDKWVASKAALREHFGKIASGSAVARGADQ